VTVGTVHAPATLLVPTYNRSRELRRLLTFLESAGNPFPILVMDGSGDEAKRRNRDLTARAANATYRDYPSGLHLGLRIAAGLNEVTTEYCVICPDDDLVFPDGVSKCCAFLAAHPGYTAAIGAVRAMVAPGGSWLRRRTLLFPDVLKGRFHLNQSGFRDRMLLLAAFTLSGCPPLYYALRPTSVARAAFGAVTPSLAYSTQEMLINCVTLAMGYAIALPVAFGLRDYSSEATRDAIRDDPVSYIPAAGFDAIEPPVARIVAEKETEGDLPTAQGVVRAVFDAWRSSVASMATVEPTLATGTLSRLHRAIDYLASLAVPGLVAGSLGVDRKVLAALMRAQAEYVRGSV